MYFSRIYIKRGPGLFHFLAEKEQKHTPYAAHQLLWKAFPKDEKADRDFLFRQENRRGLPCFYVVSSRRPANHELFEIETKDYAPRIRSGQRLAFSLTANPVVARKIEGRTRSAKHDVWMDAKREARELKLDGEKLIAHCQSRTKQWLISRAESLGFFLLEDLLSVDGYFQHQFYRRKGNRPICFSSIDYQGILEVNDPERFLRILFEGVGRARSFGCGLMLVRNI